MPVHALRSLDAELEQTEQHFTETRTTIIARKIAVIRRYVLSCVRCKKRSALSRWGFLQNYWYTQPHGCMGGDYWNASKTECCHLICPQCGYENYIYNHPQKAPLLERIDRRHIEDEQLFAEVWKQYGNEEPKRVHPKP